MSWLDRDKQVAVLTMAGGLDKPLVIQGSGSGRVLEYMPPKSPVKGADTTLTVSELLSGFSEAAINGVGTLTIPSAPTIAAFLNPADAAQTGTNLQVGSSFVFCIFNGNTVNALTVDVGAGITWAVDALFRSLPKVTVGRFRLRFTDVTVGAETADLFRLA